MPAFRFLQATALALLPALAPALAHAQCITAADLEKGVRVTFYNGDVTTVRSLGDGLFEVEEIYDDGSEHWRFHAVHSTFGIWEAPLDNGTPVDDRSSRIDWSVDVQALPAPTADAEPFAARVALVAPDGASNGSGEREVRYFDANPVVTEGCTYEAIQVGMRTVWDDPARPPKAQIWTYLVDSGLSVMTGWTSGSENQFYSEATIVAIDPM